MTGRMFGKFALHVSLGLNLIGIAADTADSAFAYKDMSRIKNNTIQDSDRPSYKLREFICKFQKLDFEEIESRFIKFNAGVSVVNKGRFRARFNVSYLIDSVKVVAVATKKFKRKESCTKEFIIPKVAKHAVLKIEILRLGFGWKGGYSIWKKVLKTEIRPPYFKVFKLTGTKLFPKIVELK